MITKYFRGLNYQNSLITGFYVVHNGNDEYYVCNYNDRYKGKNEIISLIKSLRSYEHLKANDFDFHHVIEEQHLSDITFSSQLSFNYANMPTVLLHKGEHKRYSAILHVKETRLLYLRDQERFSRPMTSSYARKSAAVKLFNDEGSHEIGHRITILKEIYDAVYEGNKILRTIINNILSEYRRILTIGH